MGAGVNNIFPFFEFYVSFFGMPQVELRLPAVLRALLQKPGRSHRWLMERCKMSASSLNRILTGNQHPSRMHMRAFCAAFPDWLEQRMLLIAHLQDEVAGAGFADREVLLLDPEESAHKELLPVFDGYLRVISHRLMAEQDRPRSERLFSAQVEWLSTMAVRVTALEADNSNS